ncbi:MAG: ABC transporter ATP-binding protein [Ruminococcaceae bacterium]|nr:ABC transporter ATP-binding protein [Oscillospiraceae bacterium]
MSQQIEVTDEKIMEEKVNPQIWKRLIKYALKYKSVLFGGIAAMLIVALADILYPLLNRYAIDVFIIENDLSSLAAYILLYIVVIVVQGFCVKGFISRAGKLEMSMAYDIRKEAFKKLQQLSMSFFDKTAVGYLLARMISDIGRISDLVAWAMIDIIWSVSFVFGSAVMMFFLNPTLALLVLSVVPVLTVISIYFQRRILRWQRKIRNTNSKITGAYNENILGAVTTKTLVREEKNFEEFRELTKKMSDYSKRSATLSGIFFPLVLLLGNIGTALALYKGVKISQIGGITLGTLAAFIQLSRQMFEPVQQIARILAEMQTAQASAERVLTLLDTEQEVVDTPEVIEKYGDEFNPKIENWPEIKGDIEFKNVVFKYNRGEVVLDDFSLKIKAGETVALVGETGAGKSTISNIVCRFYEPTEGQLLIDGVDYRERSYLWLQRNLGYVLQVPHLFSGTIADNIRYQKPEATDEEVIRAAKLVNAHEFIINQPKGYQTEVGEEGAKLSTGQKQLISFARIMISDPKIFVLDEATSSIDTETEMQIQKAIKDVMKNRTGIIVAHRLSTVRSADRILVISQGKIVEEGTHKDLMSLKGRYYDLYTNQFKESQTVKIIG